MCGRRRAAAGRRRSPQLRPDASVIVRPLASVTRMSRRTSSTPALNVAVGCAAAACCTPPGPARRKRTWTANFIRLIELSVQQRGDFLHVLRRTLEARSGRTVPETDGLHGRPFREGRRKVVERVVVGRVELKRASTQLPPHGCRTSARQHRCPRAPATGRIRGRRSLEMHACAGDVAAFQCERALIRERHAAGWIDG